jgi:6-phosphogluconolactonase
MALGGAGATQVPAAGVAGRVRTRWLLDRAAASRLPASLARIASP